MAHGRGIHRLAHKQVEAAKPGTILHDGGGLELRVDKTGARRWVMRIMVAGKRMNRGLGGFPAVPLVEARQKAAAIRDTARESGVVETKVAVARRAEVVTGLTFKQMFERYWQDKQPTLSNGKHMQQWVSTMEAYVFPHIGDRAVAEVRPSEIVDMLRPIWREKPETARRVLQRVGVVFKAAIVEELRERANPCEGIAERLGAGNRTVEHHRALPYGDVPQFLADLAESKAQLAGRLALRFVALTACRSGEARGARWSEIDLDARVWAIPAERMKARADHRVPLSAEALAVLRRAQTLGSAEYVFPGKIRGQSLSDMALTVIVRNMGYADRMTVHGLRTSFRTWAAEVAKAPDRVAETALAHVDPNEVQAAYLRSDFFEERKELMQLWGKHCCVKT